MGSDLGFTLANLGFTLATIISWKEGALLLEGSCQLNPLNDEGSPPVGLATSWLGSRRCVLLVSFSAPKRTACPPAIGPTSASISMKTPSDLARSHQPHRLRHWIGACIREWQAACGRSASIPLAIQRQAGFRSYRTTSLSYGGRWGRKRAHSPCKNQQC